MVLDALHRPERFATVRAALDSGRDGVSARALVDAAASFGLEHRALRFTSDQLTLDAVAALPLPAIAHTDGDHFVVVERTHQRSLVIVDPAVGRMTITEEEMRARFDGVLLLFAVADPTAPQRRRSRGEWGDRLLRPIIRGNRGKLAVALVLSAALAVLGLAAPAATAIITDRLVAGTGVDMPWLFGVGLLAVVVLVLSLGRGLALATVQRAMGERLGLDSVRTLLRAEYRFFTTRAPGDLVNRISSLAQVREIASSTLVAGILDTVLALSYLVIALIIDPVLGLAATLVTVALVAATWLLSVRSRQVMREELQAQSLSVARLVDAVQGIASVKVSAAAEMATEGYRRAFATELDASFRRQLLMTVSEAVIGAIGIAAPVLFLIVAATGAPSPGAAVGLAALAGAALAPAASTAGRLFTLNELGPIMERLLDIMDAAPEELEGSRSAHALSGKIQLEGVGFRYSRHALPALSDVTLSVEAGQKVAVVGPTGSGKSTLVAVITGLHRPTEGRVLFDGVDQNELTLSSLRQQLGIVLQDPYIPVGTVREAITLGRDDVGADEIEAAARTACIHDSIMAMPLGYSTVLAQGGAGLSGGERQRLSLARALVAQPRLLILDEATSALDALTEAAVERNLRARGITRIVIAHRLSTTTDADLVFVLDGGRVCESGTPEELLRQRGAYAALVGASPSDASATAVEIPHA
ncbi:peptidase domain-containing ABC transporter [Microbacterium sp. LWH12-1.2]